MSIPPLVCSTPPPPDQCEEDKDPDDFGISYSLSQDDDEDDGYNYGDFSSYNVYSSNCIAQKTGTQSVDVASAIPSDTKEVIEHESEQPKNVVIEELFGTNTSNESKSKCEEDTNIEDLGLEVNEESLSSNEKEDDRSETENDIAEDSEKVLDVGDNVSEGNTHSSPSTEHVHEACSVDNFKQILEDPIEDLSIEIDAMPSEPNSNDEISKSDEIKEETDLKVAEPNLDDDFGDYDDFQFVNTERKTSDVIESCDNPWDDGVVAETNDFGNFTANFDAIESTELTSEIVEKVDIENLQSNIEDDDDFGDFDDFKSSTIEKTEENSPESDQKMPVLDLQTPENEHQVLESINNVLSSIFEEQLLESESEFEGRLESALSETWRHLRETDVRQPYIVNWNNSLGQKTLLKALCIDSRNILFGPKWSYNMPKYAVNLAAAPLQPQKPLTPSNSSQSDAVANKTTAKQGWTDPFTADGQESCSTENDSVVEVTATDLDVFESAISRKSDKIYSSTLNVQPLRQISLPDTHIFTPTDSETPTSKTVHNGPPILLPQTLDGTTESSNTTTNAPENQDDEYWEFQDFKSSSEKSSTSIPIAQEQPKQTVSETKIDNSIKPNITYQTQVLQPIKMEPLMPTVNWPDPGHIKETFEDFTDFVSNSSWSDKQSHVPTTQTESKSALEVESTSNKNQESLDERPTPSNTEDDDFDTFQSALPTKHITSEYNFDSLAINTLSNPQESSQTRDFNAFQSVKSENISVNSITKNESLPPSIGFPSNTTEINDFKGAVSLGNTSSILQPMSSNSTSSQKHQKAGQILQPLSLESYSQINWPNPGIDLQDLSRFNPVETLQSLKSDLSVGGLSKGSSPVHSQKGSNNQAADDDWGEFVSSKPKQATFPKKPASFGDDDEWTDFVSSPTVKPQNGLNTISLNVHTNSNIQKNTVHKLPTKNNQMPIDIPSLNYITPKTGGNKTYNDRHFQNL